jgi:crossover junction endodeoxyribonuclease RuvC
MRVLGIDPGSRRTGFGVVESAGTILTHVDSGVIRMQDDSLPIRLMHLERETQATIAAHQPDAIAVEAVFHHRNSQSALILGQARGVILLCAARFGAPIVEYAPALVKRAVTGNGRSAKDVVAQMVARVLHLHELQAGDAADALALAVCHGLLARA